MHCISIIVSRQRYSASSVMHLAYIRQGYLFAKIAALISGSNVENTCKIWSDVMCCYVLFPSGVEQWTPTCRWKCTAWQSPSSYIHSCCLSDSELNCRYIQSAAAFWLREYRIDEFFCIWTYIWDCIEIRGACCWVSFRIIQILERILVWRCRENWDWWNGRTTIEHVFNVKSISTCYYGGDFKLLYGRNRCDIFPFEWINMFFIEIVCIFGNKHYPQTTEA